MWNKTLGAALVVALGLQGTYCLASGNLYRDYIETPGISEPSWKNEDVVVTVEMKCWVDSNSIGWPFTGCSEPVMSVKDRLYAGYSVAVSYSDVILPDMESRSEKSSEFVRAVLFDQLTELNILRRKFESDGSVGWQRKSVLKLDSALPKVKSYIQEKMDNAYETQIYERFLYLLYLTLAALPFALAWYAGRLIKRNWKRILGRGIDRVSEVGEKVGQSIEDRRVRRIAIDEAVKRTIHKSIDSASGSEVAELERMILAAVSRGDTDAAKALSVALDQIKSANPT